MSAGISNDLAAAWLGTLRNVPFVVGATCVQLHTGLPGASGTTNISAVTARQAAFFSAPVNGVLSITGVSSSWSMTTAETLKYISVWSDFTGGTFLWSALIASPQVVANGDTVTLTGCDLIILGEAA